jgi:competence protein ComEA
MAKTIILVVIGLVVVLVALAAVDHFTDVFSSSLAVTSEVSSSLDALTVTISGEVKRPGTYLLPLTSSLSDLINSANGLTTNADEKAFDTSFLLESKQSFYIAPLYDESAACGAAPLSKVNINTADKTALMTVDGVGTSIASAIVSYREKNGNFKRIEALKDCEGIGNATFEKMKNYVQIKS